MADPQDPTLYIIQEPLYNHWVRAESPQGGPPEIYTDLEAAKLRMASLARWFTKTPYRIIDPGGAVIVEIRAETPAKNWTDGDYRDALARAWCRMDAPNQSIQEAELVRVSKEIEEYEAAQGSVS